MAYNNILTTLEDNILIIQINRESKLNALTLETLKEIKHVVDEAQSAPDVHGMILTGIGEKAFAAGAAAAADGVPGPVRLAQSAHDRVRHPGRAADHP